jgi:hypothetical protein
MHHGAVRIDAFIRILMHPGRRTTFGKIVRALRLSAA